MLEPWDLLRGKDVFRDGQELAEDLDAADIRHWAPNCATFSRAREIPIPGVKSAPIPLRSEEFPRGIPCEVDRMSSKAKRRLELDTNMADMAAKDCTDADEKGKIFTLEHPGRSIALHLESWKTLLQRRRVRAYHYHTCMFEGSRRKKFQVLITNSEYFLAMGRECKGGKICDRTGEPHLKWRPTVTGGKVLQFTTGDEREYPKGFCSAYAACISELLGSGKSFIEIFSGPNAPLSQAVSDLIGIPLPGKRRESVNGLKKELQDLSQLILAPTNIPGAEELHSPVPWLQPRTENDRGRAIAVEAGKQPGYGKRVQLIPDGLNDPVNHLNRAVTLSHPFGECGTLKEDHRMALEMMPEMPTEANSMRLSVLGSWKALANSREVGLEQEQHELLACKSAELLGRKPRTALMELLQTKYRIEDTSVPKLCLTGMPIVGRALESPFFNKWEVPSEMTLEELLRTAQSRRNGTIEKVRFMSRIGGKALAQAIHAKTMKEVSQGTMSGPWSHEQLIERHGRHYNVVPSFGLAQGHDELGAPKYRRIDDHSAGMTNAAAFRTQKIEMAMTDYLMVMIRNLADKFDSGVHLSTEDLKGAYRQVPLPDKQVGLSITAVFNPALETVELFEIYGQPFGAGHAVPNFYRVAEWISRAFIRGFQLVLDHFFDDYFLVERPECSEISAFCVTEGFRLLGFATDPDKTQVPACVADILGVRFNCEALSSERTLRVEAKPSRKVNFKAIVQKVLDDDFLPPTLAASLVGKFGFLCSTLFGKVGRACTTPVRERQYSVHASTSLTSPLRHSLQLMLHIIDVSPPRLLSLKTEDKPFLLYTDASDVPERHHRFIVGGVLIYPPPTRRVEYFTYIVPQLLVDQWLPKQTYMGQLEVLAAPLSLSTWKQALRHRRVLHFVDNDAAAAGLVRGYSQKVDSSLLISHYWSIAAEAAIDPYIDRVESKSNLSDGPSRLELLLMQQLQAHKVEPDYEFLFNFSRWDTAAPAPAVSKLTPTIT